VGAAELVRELSRRFRSGDVEGARAIYADGIRLQQPASLPHGGWHEGLAGLDAMAATFASHWDRSIADARILDVDAATAVQVTTQTWTSKATGRAATVDVVELFTVADGRIAEIRVFQQDTAALLATL
jgi:ketosteroid isomerase-like protein